MEKLEQIYEGKAKKVFKTSDPDKYIVSYKDDATAFNGEKRGTILGKGAVNNRVSNYLMQKLEEAGVPTHFVEQLSDTDTVVKRVKIIPLEVIIRNICAGSMAKNYGIAEGTPLNMSTIEFSLKNDALGDPLINQYHVAALGILTPKEIDHVIDLAFKVNDFLGPYLYEAGIVLVDFKLEFGKLDDETIILADEISPDTCRLWDKDTGKKLDKDRFRRDLGDVEDAYKEVQKRLLGE